MRADSLLYFQHLTAGALRRADTITVPCMLVGWLDELWAALVLDFISVLTYWTINEVARDIEDVFFYDPNDAPLARLQWDFNRRLLAALQAVEAADLGQA